jgi:uncharacterized protein (DUF2141 family)
MWRAVVPGWADPMRESSTAVGLSTILVATLTSHAGVLVVDAHGFSDTTGVAVVRVFAKVESIARDAPLLTKRARIRAGRAEARFDTLPAGKWAVMVFHDRNANGKVDHGWNRLPLEDMGFSNGFVPTLFTGVPTWEKLAVPLIGPMDTLRMVVKPFSLTNSEQRKSL